MAEMGEMAEMAEADATVQELQTLAEQMRQMRATIAEQQEAMVRQQEQLARLEAALAQPVQPRAASIVEARTVAQETADEGTVQGSQSRKGGKRSRRTILRGAGMAAAVATVALVASEGQSAHAAPTTNGNPLLIGETNQASAITSLELPDGESINAAYYVDAGISAISGTIGVSGVSGGANGIGVQGYGAQGTGVVGYGGPVGIQGHATGSGSQGVAGYSDSGYGVSGVSTSSVDVYAQGTGRFLQKLQGSAGAPTYAATEGEMARDSNGELWLCIGSGTPGTWVKAAHAEVGLTGGAVSYLPHPIRLLDTRPGERDAAVGGGGQLTDQQPNPSYTLLVGGAFSGGVTVPTSAVGAVGNVTVVASSDGPGYVSLVPHGAIFSGTSNINYTPSQTIANCFISGLSPDGKLDIYVGGAATDVVIDLFAVVS